MQTSRDSSKALRLLMRRHTYLIGNHWAGVLGTMPGARLPVRRVWRPCTRTGASLQQQCGRIRSLALLGCHAANLSESNGRLIFTGLKRRRLVCAVRLSTLTLYNGGILRGLRRSPAVDFWHHRERGNFVRITRRTGAVAEAHHGLLCDARGDNGQEDLAGSSRSRKRRSAEYRRLAARV